VRNFGAEQAPVEVLKKLHNRLVALFWGMVEKLHSLADAPDAWR
jgi:succinylglutamate desuccinylase